MFISHVLGDVIKSFPQYHDAAHGHDGGKQQQGHGFQACAACGKTIQEMNKMADIYHMHFC